MRSQQIAMLQGSGNLEEDPLRLAALLDLECQTSRGSGQLVDLLGQVAVLESLPLCRREYRRPDGSSLSGR